MTEFLQFTVSGLAIGLVYSLVALGWTIIIDVSGIVNLAQGELLMAGGLTAAYLVDSTNWPMAAAVLVALLAASGLAGLLDWGVLRRVPTSRPASLIFVTIGASLALKEIARLLFGPDTLYFKPVLGSEPFKIGGAAILPQHLLIAASLIVAATLLALFFRRTRFGKAMRASVQSPIGARVVGISPATMRTIAFVVGGFLGGAAGILVAPLFGMSWNAGTLIGLNGFVAAVFGGVGSYPGAVVGGIILGLLHGYAAGYLPTAYTDVITLSLLVVMLLLRPSGIFGRGRALAHV